MSALLLASGMKHFRTPQFYYPVVPEYLCRRDEPGSKANGALAVMSREEWVASSGLIEAALGVGLLIPATRKAAADATTAMFTVFLAGHIDALRRAYGPEGTPAERRIHTLRLPLQAPLILWSWSLRK
ncbi:DoxX family protein [Paenarthrobacter sp. NCHU4564]|uniref:DoxX family protein n=1 Tax=Paenarthrobacter sp. NCHU4564 TaxID=3451353 RepID=UPI003F95CA29